MIRLGLVGRGPWGQRIARTVRAPTAPFGAELAWQIGRDISLHQQIRQQPVDGLLIATPPATHAALVLTAWGHELPVFVEKPFTCSLWEAAPLEATRGKTPVTLVNHVHLFHPAYVELKRLLRIRGQFVTGVTSHGGGDGPFRADVPPLWDYGPHDVAFAIDLTGSPDLVEAARVPSETTCGTNYELRLHSAGVTALLCVGSVFRVKTRRLVVTTAREVYSLDDRSEWPLQSRGDGTLPVKDRTPPLEAALRCFVEAIEGKYDPRLGINLALRVTRTLDAAERLLAEPSPS